MIIQTPCYQALASGPAVGPDVGQGIPRVNGVLRWLGLSHISSIPVQSENVPPSSSPSTLKFANLAASASISSPGFVPPTANGTRSESMRPLLLNNPGDDCCERHGERCEACSKTGPRLAS